MFPPSQAHQLPLLKHPLPVPQACLLLLLLEQGTQLAAERLRQQRYQCLQHTTQAHTAQLLTFNAIASVHSRHNTRTDAGKQEERAKTHYSNDTPLLLQLLLLLQQQQQQYTPSSERLRITE